MSLIHFSSEDKRYNEDGCVYDEYGTEISPLHDDYYYYKTLQEDMNDPLSDDYIPEKYR